MGHDIAGKVGITMIGRAVNRRYLVFTGGERFVRHSTGSLRTAG
jgi:FdhD protein